MAADSASAAQIMGREELIECIRTDLGYGWHPVGKIGGVVRRHTDTDISDAALARLLADMAKNDLIKQRTGYGTTRRWMVPYKPPE
jgi:hypothetical protein